MSLSQFTDFLHVITCSKKAHVHVVYSILVTLIYMLLTFVNFRGSYYRGV